MFETAPPTPYPLFASWYAQAAQSEPEDPNAMALATADARGRSSVRMVLMKDVDERGFVFYSHRESRKGRDLAANPWASLCFHWKSLGRQVRAEGAVSPVTDAEADAYFATRPRISQIGAWASVQSRPLPDRQTFEQRVEQYEKQYADQAVPRPPHWSGWRLTPTHIEFWQARDFRLHERLVYDTEGTESWSRSLLYP